MEDWVRCSLCVEILGFDRIAAELRMFISETEMVGYKVKNSINQIHLCEPNLFLIAILSPSGLTCYFSVM